MNDDDDIDAYTNVMWARPAAAMVRIAQSFSAHSDRPSCMTDISILHAVSRVNSESACSRPAWPVRVPRPLSNLMKGEGCGFKLTGDEVHLTSDRGKELQGLIDDEFRKAALASLKHVLDFKIFEVEQHTATLDSMATKLRHSVDALFTGTEIAADVRTARTDAALKAFEVNAAEKLETAEVSRRNAEISKEKEAKRMNDAELEAREIRNGQTFAANVSQKTTEIVTLNRAESEKLLLETIAGNNDSGAQLWTQGDT
eukprot:COSAG03_NODE_1408_length_4138_cov_4.868779_4_plen_257_part_00